MRTALSMLVLKALLASGASALERADRFDRDFNRAAKIAKIQHRSQKAECNAATCEYILTPAGRMSVVHSDSNMMVVEIAFYFPPEVRSGADVMDVLGAMIGLVSKDQPKLTREGARLHLIEQAAGSARDGEIRLGRWRYVLRPNDGRDVRLYIRLVE